MDHSFSSSDSDDGSNSGNAGKKKNLKVEKEIQPAHQKHLLKPLENKTSAVSATTDGLTKLLKSEECKGSNRAELKDNISKSMEEERRRASSDSSVSSNSDSNLWRSNKSLSPGVRRTRADEHEEEGVPSSGLSDIHQDEDSDQDNDYSSYSSVSRLSDRLVSLSPGCRRRKNFSFSNDQVQSIERENQRLNQNLSDISQRSRPGSIAGSRASMTRNSPRNQITHSTINRQREQQRIERENLAFLKRLESAKPTPGLQRLQQLADYQRLIEYPGGLHGQCVRPRGGKRATPRRLQQQVRGRSVLSTTSTDQLSPSPTPEPKL